MVIYCLLMILLGVTFWILGNKISNGHTELIHQYHQTNVSQENKCAYSKNFSKGMYGLALSMMASGVVALLNFSSKIYVGIFLFGVAISLWQIVNVQKKYNGGIF